MAEGFPQGAVARRRNAEALLGDKPGARVPRRAAEGGERRLGRIVDEQQVPSAARQRLRPQTVERLRDVCRPRVVGADNHGEAWGRAHEREAGVTPAELSLVRARDSVRAHT